MICPKCKVENSNNATKCTSCGMLLKTACSFCKSLNKIGTIKCESCAKEILKKCLECGVVNVLKAKKCRKCGSLFDEKKIQPSEKTELASLIAAETLEEYVVLAVEFINASSVSQKIQNTELIKKVFNKFYQLYAKQAKIYGAKAKKTSPSSMIIEFEQSSTTQESINNGFNAALDAYIDLEELNFVLRKKLNIDLKLKTGLSLSQKEKKSFAQNEKEAARAGEIVFFDSLKSLVDENIYMIQKKQTQSETACYELIERKSQKKIPLEKENKKTDEIQPQPKIKHKEYEREQAAQLILPKINETQQGQVIALRGPEGIGKSSFINNVRQVLSADKAFWLMGQCYKIHNHIPYSYFQDVLKNLFNIPSQNVNVDESTKIVLDVLNNKLGISHQPLQDHLLALIFPRKSNQNSPIMMNKEKTLQALQTVFDSICKTNKLVLVIEDIEYIDQSSLDLLKIILSNSLLEKDIKVLITTSVDVEIENVLQIHLLNTENTTNIKLKPLSRNEINQTISGMITNKDVLPKAILDQIYEHSKGLPIYVEETLMLLMQTGALSINPEKRGEFIAVDELDQIKLPADYKDIMKVRLNNIAQMSANAFKVVCYAGILGFKFMPTLIKNILELTNEEFNEIVEILVVSGIFAEFNSYNFVFKNRSIWESVYNIDITQENKIACFMDLNQGLIKLTSSNAAILAENAAAVKLSPQYIYNFIDQAAQEAYSVGDDNAYSALKLKMIEMIDNTEIEDKEKEKNKISEDLARLNYMKKPKEAIRLLPRLIQNYEKSENISKVIELSGYMSKSCELVGNFAGAIEAVEKVGEKVDKHRSPNEFVFISYSKLEFLLNLGRLEEVIIIARTEVLPGLRKIFEQNTLISGLNNDELMYVELDTRYLLTKALVMQGRKEALSEAEKLSKIANEYKNPDYALKSQLMIGMFRAIQGDTTTTKAILESITEVVQNTHDKVRNFAEWHFINNLNNLMMKDYDSIKEQISGLIEFLHKSGNFFYQPIIKAFVGKVFKEDQNIKAATDIYYEEIHTCSENKYATGALLLWYLISEAEMQMKNYDKALAVSQKALEISQNPSINNHLFLVMFHKMLSELHLAKGELDMAQMYADKGIQLASSEDLLIWEIKLGLLYAQIFRIKASLGEGNKEENVKLSYKLHLQVLDSLKQIQNPKLVEEVEKSSEELSQFCSKEGIVV